MPEAQWEYKIVQGSKDTAERHVNEAAAEGWEPFLMGVTSGPPGMLAAVTIMLRRPKRPA